MTESQELFYDLLRVSLDEKESLTRTPTEKEWEIILEEARKQTIDGVLLSGLERLPDEQRPPRLILLQWIGHVQNAEQNTRRIAQASFDVVQFFNNNGFACTLLKGVAVSRYYPVPERRQSGDVDIWLEGGRKNIYDVALAFSKSGRLEGVNYHHVKIDLQDDVEIEVHIWPSFLSSPLRNWRLHVFCNLHIPTMESSMPSLAFDRVFILLHCYMHMCGHGVGLRQIMDYFYVLKQGFTEEEKKDAVYWIEQLGMRRFACGLMWVLQKYFGLEEKYQLMVPDEKEGQFIIQEVMQTGNMGHSDTRNWGSMKSSLTRFFFNLKRDFYLAKHYPHESIWQPFFSLWLYIWRLSNGFL